MRFPGRTLLHTWDLTQQRLSLDDLLGSCRQVGLTGFAELKLSSGSGMILFYAGAVVSTVYREGPVGYNGPEALDHVRAAMTMTGGEILVYELPLPMAHLLRGITNRHRLPSGPRTPAELMTLLEQMKAQGHTGMMEVQAHVGAAAILMVSGRISQIYWDSGEGLTLEQGPALLALQLGLKGEEAPVFLSSFSSEVWRARTDPMADWPSGPEVSRTATGGPRAVDHESALRTRALETIDAQLPAMIQVLLFDMLTGAVLVRRDRGPESLRTAVFADKLPGLTLYLRGLVIADGQDDLEIMDISTLKLVALVACVSETQEAIGVIAEKSQPTAQIASVLLRVAHAYGAQRRRVTPAASDEGVKPAPPPIF